MNIKLISCTELPLDVMYVACKNCCSEDNAGDLWQEMLDEDFMKKLVLKVAQAGHQSILENVQLTFTIDGVSRALSHQLVRHRHANYAQKSQRYVKFTQPFKYVTPKTIQENSLALQKYNEIMDNIYNSYKELTNLNIPAEDARYVLPNACETSIVMSCNLREFIHICNERLCKNAQTEIRKMVKEMVNQVLFVDDLKFMEPLFAPKCTLKGGCQEIRKCNKK